MRHRSPTVLLVFLLSFLASGCISDGGPQELRLRVMAYNIKHGHGNDGVVDLERAAAVIEAVAPDVVTLQEVDERCGRSGEVDQAAWLGERLGMESIFGTFMDYDGGRYGMALLSRLPIIEWTNHVLPPGAEPRSAPRSGAWLSDLPLGSSAQTRVAYRLPRYARVRLPPTYEQGPGLLKEPRAISGGGGSRTRVRI